MKLRTAACSTGGYGHRTREVIRRSDYSILLNVDMHSMGAKCTRNAINATGIPAREIHYDIYEDTKNLDRLWLEFINVNMEAEVIHKESYVLNLAGNGIKTWARIGVTQRQLNKLFVKAFELSKLSRDKVVTITGGQTGIDLAASVGSYIHGLETRILLPKGWMVRNEEGVDKCFETREAFEAFFMKEVENTKADLNLEV